MDPNILKKIYNKTEDINKSLVSVDGTVTKLLKLRKEDNKEDDKLRKAEKAEERRKKQLEKREEQEGIKEEEVQEKKKEENKKNGIVEMIKGALSGVLSGLGSALTGIGSLLTTAIGGLGIGAMIGSALSAAAPLLLTALVGVIGWKVWEATSKQRKKIDDNINRYINRHFFGRELQDDTIGVEEQYKTSFNEMFMADTQEEKDEAKAQSEALKEVLDMMRTRDAMTHQLLEAQKDVEGELTDGQKAALARQGKTVDEFKAEQQKKVDDLKRNIEIKQEQIDKLYDKESKSLKPIQRQTGGMAIRRQTGGMVPTLLEPGEKVFMPGQWDESVSALNSIIPRFQTGGLVQSNHPETGPGWSMGKDYKGRPVVLHKSAAEGLLDAIKASDGMVKTSDVTSSQRTVEKNRAVGGVPNSNHLTGYAVDIHGTSKSWLKENGPKYGWKNLVYSGHDGHFDFNGTSGDPGVPPQQGDGKEKTADTDGSQGGGSGIFGGLKGILEGMGGLFEGVSGLFEGIAEGIGDLALDGSLGGFGNELLSGLGGGVMGIGGLGLGMFEGATSGDSGGTSGDSGGMDLSGVSAGGDYGKDSLIKALDSAGITNKKERAMFLAQMHHESGGFRYREEIHDGSNYEGRTDLGNTQPGDGRRYKGRGYIQLTGRSNYRQYGKIIGVDLEKNPELAADPEVAAKVALAYWNKRVNRTAAQKGDVLTVTRNINGGTNGLDDRRNQYNYYSKQGYQTGGITSLSGNNQTISRMKAAQEKFAEGIAEATNPAPIVVFEDEPSPTIAESGDLNNKAPDLPDGPSTIQAAEYFYKLNLGGNI